jgi:hypothetical protein
LPFVFQPSRTTFRRPWRHREDFSGVGGWHR